MRPRILAVVIILLATALAGCTFGGKVCSNDTDKYRCDFGGSDQIHREEEWENTGERANVTLRAGGTAKIRVRLTDANGTVVFNHRFEITGGTSDTERTDPGVPGTWTVEIDGEYTGGMDVKVVTS